MKITVKRSRWPWGKPSLIVDLRIKNKYIEIKPGCHWNVIYEDTFPDNPFKITKENNKTKITR